MPYDSSEEVELSGCGNGFEEVWIILAGSIEAWRDGMTGQSLRGAGLEEGKQSAGVFGAGVEPCSVVPGR